MNYAVKMKAISKQFPKVLANDNVDFDVLEGEIHALVGENGAGKSTLMNLLYGIYTPTSGDIYIKGKKVVMNSALDAIGHGIGMVHQHFMLIPRLTVADNIVLGDEPRRGLFYNRREANRKVKAVCEKYGLYVDPNAKVTDISLGMQQRVEIVKALYRGADIIILDEPTAVLTPQEIDELITVLKELKSIGKTIIIITHKLDEVMNVSDRVTILRLGKKIGTVNTNETSPEEITKMMVGRHVELGGDKKQTQYTENILELQNISYTDGRRQILKDISLSVKKGEVLGIAGIDGSGQTQLTEIVAGVITPDTGRIIYNLKDITSQKVKERKYNGIGFIPQDRHKHGLVLDFSIEENLIMGFQRESGYIRNNVFMNFEAINKNACEKIEKFDIRTPNEKVSAATLSGGNQQKIIIAREAGCAPDLIVADQPTRGVDIGAIEFIHNVLVDLRNSGKGVLLVSLELDEVMMLSDRIAVMYEGKLMGIIDAKTAKREEIGLMMVGKSNDKNIKEVG